MVNSIEKIIESSENGSLKVLLMVEKNPHGEKNKKMKERKKKARVPQHKSLLFIDDHDSRSSDEYGVDNEGSNSTQNMCEKKALISQLDIESNGVIKQNDCYHDIANKFPKIKMDVRYIMAPMVNQSDPCFRSLCLKYGATCVYTEMLYSHKIVNNEGYLKNRLQIIDHTFCGSNYISRPLIVQICGNDPITLSKCMLELLEYSKVCPIDGIDFNLGCPQDRAKDGLYGSYLLDKCHWPLVFECVKAMTTTLQVSNSHNIDANNTDNDANNTNNDANNTNYDANNTNNDANNTNDANDEKDNNIIPLFCKIRICEDGVDNYKATEAFVNGLHESGASLVAIHGRTRGSAKKRRCGKADLNIIRKIAEHFKEILPIISNGNIMSREDVTTAAVEASPACGLMSAEGLLADPCLFFRNKVYDHVHDDDDQNEGRVNGKSNFERRFEAEFISNNTESNDGDFSTYDSNSTFNSKKMRLSNTETKHSTECKDNINTNDKMDKYDDINDKIDKYDDINDKINGYDDAFTKVNDINVHSTANYTLSDDESAVINNTKKSTHDDDNLKKITNFTKSNHTQNDINQTLTTPPDRASLFEEYCHLSELFFVAGGWRGLQTRDLDFPEKIHMKTNEERNYGDECEGGRLCDDIINNRNNDKNISNDMNDENYIKDSNNIPESNNISNNGHTKQMEIARQHLNFMLEKRGHGGSVRYNHMGAYKRHTDLLNDIKNSTTIQQLVLISKLCLRNFIMILIKFFIYLLLSFI